LNTSDEKLLLSFEDRKKIAKIKFPVLIVERNILFQTAESILNFFQDLGKDLGILFAKYNDRSEKSTGNNK